MLDIPQDVQDLLTLIATGVDSKARQFAYKLLSSKLERYGLRWEYFV